MSEQTTPAAAPTTTEANGQAQAPAKARRVVTPKTDNDKAAMLAYASREEAEQHRPDRKDFRLLTITFGEAIPAGTVVYTWLNWLPALVVLQDLGVSAEWADKPAKAVTATDAIQKLLDDGLITEAQAEKMRAKAQK
jgi:hypothetical protein